MNKLLLFAVLYFILFTLGVTTLLGVVTFNCFSQNKNTKAEPSRTIDSLFTLLRTDKPDTGKIIHLNNLSDEYIKTGFYDSAKQYGNNALQLALKLNYNKGIINSYNNIGLGYWEQGDYPKALDYYFKALKIAEKSGDKSGIGKTFENMGKVYLRLGSSSKTLDYSFKALKIAEEFGDKNKIASLLMGIGNIRKSDTLYLYTDGYADQFGGPKGKKFKYKQLENLLLTINQKSMEEQKQILSEVFEKWKGDIEQVDDILIIGIKYQKDEFFLKLS